MRSIRSVIPGPGGFVLPFLIEPWNVITCASWRDCSRASCRHTLYVLLAVAGRRVTATVIAITSISSVTTTAGASIARRARQITARLQIVRRALIARQRWPTAPFIVGQIDTVALAGGNSKLAREFLVERRESI